MILFQKKTKVTAVEESIWKILDSDSFSVYMERERERETQ